MSHSPKHFDEIPSLFSASCPFGKMSVRQNVRRQNVRSAKCLSAKCLSAKCPGTNFSVLKKVPEEPNFSVNRTALADILINIR